MKSFLIVALALFSLRRAHGEVHGTIVTSSMHSDGPNGVNGYASRNGILSHMRQSYTTSDSTAAAITSSSSQANSGLSGGGEFSVPSYPVVGVEQVNNVAQSSSSSGATAGTSGAYSNVPTYQAAPNCLGSDCSSASVVQMDSVLRPGEYVPNCGCVPRGSCQREIGDYTRLVGQYSDVVCGFTFERCCFDGPCPGVLDEFVRAAPCVPQELCLRPYGVLPTDVRDFGIIAPCPGQGAVRCITVDDATLLEFQAAVAAIEASSVRYTENAASISQVAPAQAISTVTSTASQTPVAVVAPEPLAVTVPIVAKPELPVQAVANTDNSFGSELATLLASAGITSGGTVTSNTVQPVQPVTTTTTVVSPPPVVAPPSSGFIRTPSYYGFDCRSTGCYTPWAYRNYGFYPYPGAGFGFRKGFHFSKGFGYGLY